MLRWQDRRRRLSCARPALPCEQPPRPRTASTSSAPCVWSSAWTPSRRALWPAVPGAARPRRVTIRTIHESRNLHDSPAQAPHPSSPRHRRPHAHAGRGSECRRSFRTGPTRVRRPRRRRKARRTPLASYSEYVHPLQHTHAIETAVDYLNKADLMDTDWKDIWGDPETNRENWKQHDPYYLADKLRSVPVHLSSGDGTAGVLDPPGFEDEYIPGLEDPDEPFAEDVVSPTETLMDRESKAVAQQLQKAGADVTTHFYKGTHSPQYWKREFQRSLPMLLYALGTRPAGR
nr:alpha/beta hydrolase-fold protein [Streptomyces sp. AVP053U2]